MRNDAEFLSSLYEELPMPVLIISRNGDIICGNKALYSDFPSLKTNNSLSLIFPKDAAEHILSAKKTEQMSLTGLNLKLTLIPSGDFICIQFLKKNDSCFDDMMMSSLLLPVPHIFRTSISEMLLSVSSVYAIGEREENDELMEAAKKLNLNCYKILRGNNLVTSYCRELTSGTENPEVVNLSHLVKTVSEASRAVLNDIGTEVIIDIRDDIVPVSARESSLVEALLAVIDNAARFSGKNPVKISLKKLSSSAQIIVADKGIGIPGNVMEHIFEPYFTYNRDAAPLEGVGLGLTLARLAVLKWGGSINVSSKEYEGCTVVMTFPLTNTEKDVEFNSKVTLANLLRDRFSPLQVMLADNDTCPLP